MIEINQLDQLTLARHDKVTVALGVFDGVHRAHQALVRTCAETAKERHGTSAIFTFKNHPAEVLAPDRQPPLITPHTIKRELLADLGIDLLVAPTFDRRLASISPQQFIENILGQRLAARTVLIGFNFRFGRGGLGDSEMLSSYQGKLFDQVRVMPVVEYDGAPLSSTRIRQAITAGDLSAVELMLGRRHRLAGEVVPGEGRGRQLGFPTANLEVLHQATPPVGIYGCRVFFEPTSTEGINGLLYIGSASTFRGAPGEDSVRVEVFLMDWEKDLYGQTLFVEILCPIREDRIFENSQDLVNQIKRDREFFESWLKRHPEA